MSKANAWQLMRRFDFAATNSERPILNKFHGVLIQSELYMRITRREER